MNITELLTTPDGEDLVGVGGEVAKERPILFSGPMIRALLDGKKTQTRRVVKPQPQLSPNEAYWHWPHLGGSSYWKADSNPHPDRWTSERIFQQCPYGDVGDRLWCRETWAKGMVFAGDVQEYLYRATHTRAAPPWRPSIFMPRAACRITLEITDVRVERVQDISEEDAIAEGVSATRVEWWQVFMRHNTGGRGVVEVGGDAPPDWMEAPEKQVETISAVRHYQALWDSINAKRGHEWASNPWAWVVSFRRVAP